MLDEIRAAGGEVFAITSEPQALATEAAEDWEIEFPAVGDPHHEIRELCAERGWVDVFYNEDYGHLRHRSWASHPKGYYQPAVLALHKSGRVLYRWRCVPKYSNMSGAGARPEAGYTWDKVKVQMDAVQDAPVDTAPTLGAQDLSWPRFLLILFAHGWFLRPKAFPLGRETDGERVSPGAMMPRVYGFVALWILLFLLLPLPWFGVALAGYLLAITPGMIEIHRQFQNEPEAY
ncbi:MAG: hypothetical protein AAF513_16100 [Pseudomonadota bacterium]